MKKFDDVLFAINEVKVITRSLSDAMRAAAGSVSELAGAWKKAKYLTRYRRRGERMKRRK